MISLMMTHLYDTLEVQLFSEELVGMGVGVFELYLLIGDLEFDGNFYV